MVGATILICIIGVFFFSSFSSLIHSILGIFVYIAVKTLFRWEKETIEENKRLDAEHNKNFEIWKKHRALPGEILVGASKEIVRSRWGDPHHIEKKPRTYKYFYDKQKIRYKNHVTFDSSTNTVVSFSSSRREK